MKQTVTILFLLMASVTLAQEKTDLELWNESIVLLRTADSVSIQSGWLKRVPIWNVTKRIKKGRSALPHEMRLGISAEKIQEFIDLLEFEDPNGAYSMHRCLGRFTVRFRREEKVVYVLHFAHGKFWNPITENSQTDVIDFLDSLGFPASDWVNTEKEKEQNSANKAVDAMPTNARLFHFDHFEINRF